MGQKLNNRWDWKTKRSFSRRKPVTPLQRLAKSILLLGLTLLAATAGLEAAYFPWESLLYDMGFLALTEPADPVPPNQGGQIGVIKLPRLGVSASVAEGTEPAQLAYAVGHLPGTVSLGREGNCVLFGYGGYLYHHPFRYAKLLRSGDQIILSDGSNRYIYEVYEKQKVTSTDQWVLEPVKGERSIVTLVTDAPSFTGEKRRIVRARLLRAEA